MRLFERSFLPFLFNMYKLPIKINFSIQLDKILSENSLYAPSFAKRRGYSYLRLSDTAREYKGEIEGEVRSLISKIQMDFLFSISNIGIKVHADYEFCLPFWSLYNKHGMSCRKLDLTNMIKSVEDTFTEVLRFDDKVIFKSSSTKVPLAADSEKSAINCTFKIYPYALDLSEVRDTPKSRFTMENI